MAQFHLIMAALVAISYLKNEHQTNDLQLNTHEWNSYKAAFNKSYESNEIDSLRKYIFFANKHKVDKFNHQNKGSFELGINHLSDWTDNESTQLRGLKGLKRNPLTGRYLMKQNEAKAQQFLDEILQSDKPVPDEVDWRKVANRVSLVKNQGHCGSCWAFSAIGALEGQEIKHNKSSLLQLSEQNLVDCADNGCQGGLMDDAFQYAAAMGVESETAYPYTAKTGKCRYQREKVAFKDAGYADLPLGDEKKLKEVVARYGPVSVGIDASTLAFNYYKKGVLVDTMCSDDSLDHGVLVVGYGTDKRTKLDYWIVKNSWGPEWGDAGYIRMARNKNNMCGIASAASIPIF